MFKKFSPQRGFTLIELLSATAIFVVIGTIAVSIIFFTLRGSKKADLSQTVRKNGDIALSQMARTLRYSLSVDSPSCIPSNSSSAITVTSLRNEKTTFSCSAIANAIAANGVSFIDTKTVSVGNCSFVCRQQSNLDTPAVTIKFTLTSKDIPGFLGSKVSVPFQTTVSLRNINNWVGMIGVLPTTGPPPPTPRPTTPTPTPTPTPANGIVSGEVYRLINQCGGKALDVTGASTTDGTKIQQWSWNGGTHQQWKIETTNSGYYRLTAQHSSRVLDVDSASTANGVQLIQWPWLAGANQQWDIVNLGSDYKLLARHSV